MPSQRVTFRFGGANQNAGQRHVQIGTLVEALNVRQLKAGEYRKRRGFDRTDPLETLVVDTTTSRRGTSIVAQNMLSLGTTSEALPGGVEQVLGSGTAQINSNIAWYWPALGASRIKVGLTTLVIIGTNPGEIRVRAGGTSSTISAVSGTLVHTEAAPVGSQYNLEFVSAEFAVPSGASGLQYNGFSAALCGVDTESFTGWFMPIGGSQTIGLPATRNLTFGGSSETMLGEWIVDFDQFATSVSNLTVGAAALLSSVQVSETCTVRVRVGGTQGTTDGTLATSFTAGSAGHRGGSSTFAKPTGIQLVKLTGSMTSGNSTVQSMSVLLVAQ